MKSKNLSNQFLVHMLDRKNKFLKFSESMEESPHLFALNSIKVETNFRQNYLQNFLLNSFNLDRLNNKYDELYNTIRNMNTYRINHFVIFVDIPTIYSINFSTIHYMQYLKQNLEDKFLCFTRCISANMSSIDIQTELSKYIHILKHTDYNQMISSISYIFSRYIELSHIKITDKTKYEIIHSLLLDIDQAICHRYHLNQANYLNTYDINKDMDENIHSVLLVDDNVDLIKTGLMAICMTFPVITISWNSNNNKTIGYY